MAGLTTLVRMKGKNMIQIGLDRGLRVAKMLRGCLLRLAAQMAVSASLAASSTPAAGTQPVLMELEREIALALSACVPLVADKAAGYANCRMLIVRAVRQ